MHYTTANVAFDSEATRRATALESCQQSAGKADPGTSCECVIVVADGRSPLPRSQFEQMARDAATPQSVPLRAAAHTSSATVPAAAAPTCSAPRYGVEFSDGTRGCLEDYPLGNVRPAGQTASVLSMVPAHGLYHLALPRQPGQCPPAAGYAAIASTTSAVAYDTQSGLRERVALLSCQQSVGERAAPGSPCECITVVADGRSPLPRAQFEELARKSGARDPGLTAVGPSQPSTAPATTDTSSAPAVATTPNNARASAPGTVATAPAAAASPIQPPAVGGTAPSAAEFADLRRELAQLRSQLDRQEAVQSGSGGRASIGPRLRTRALVIGNSAYAGAAALPNPRRDAQAIADKLRSFGIEVDLVVDSSRAALVDALNNYLSKAAGTDVNILFYAGHGVQVSGVNYLIPVDLGLASASVGSIRLNAVSLNDALEYLPARTRVVFLDACRDNPLSRSLMASRSSVGPGLAPVNTSSGTLVAYATKDGSTAEDGAGNNSPYTRALLQHLDAEEDIAVVLRRVRQAVLAATNQRQEPWEYGSLVGDQLVLSRLGR